MWKAQHETSRLPRAYVVGNTISGYPAISLGARQPSLPTTPLKPIVSASLFKHCSRSRVCSYCCFSSPLLYGLCLYEANAAPYRQGTQLLICSQHETERGILRKVVRDAGRASEWLHRFQRFVFEVVSPFLD